MHRKIAPDQFFRWILRAVDTYYCNKSVRTRIEKTVVTWKNVLEKSLNGIKQFVVLDP
jgi:hypothetical protein